MATPAYWEARHVGILFSIDAPNIVEACHQLKTALTEDVKKVEVLSFIPRKKMVPIEGIDSFYAGDLGFWGDFKSEKVLKFIKTPFDYLFYLDPKPNPYLLGILGMCKAKCRIGIAHNALGPYTELMINPGAGATTIILAEEMLKYSKKLN